MTVRMPLSFLLNINSHSTQFNDDHSTPLNRNIEVDYFFIYLDPVLYTSSGYKYVIRKDIYKRYEDQL